MLRPYAIAVDTNNRLWVCEDDNAPNRYWSWSAGGTLYQDFFGSQPYSTAGYFDPKDPDKFYAFNARYIVDYEKGTWRPDGRMLSTRKEEALSCRSLDPTPAARSWPATAASLCFSMAKWHSAGSRSTRRSAEPGCRGWRPTGSTPTMGDGRQARAGGVPPASSCGGTALPG